MTNYPWTDEPALPPGADMAHAFARLFKSESGAEVLAHLRRLTVERVLPPTATDAELRHLEGQRALVKLIETQIERGSK